MHCRRGFKRVAILAFAVISAFSAGPAFADSRVRVFAAASLAQPLSEILASVDGADGVFASSGTLARQIQSGAPADIYISAHPKWTEFLVSKGILEKSSVDLYLRNSLVVVAGEDIGENFEFDRSAAALFARHRLAIGDPDHVPAGLYARQSLESAGLWEEFRTTAIRAASVRGALAFVERGAVGYGIVYASDAVAGKSIKVVAEIPDSMHDPILYTIALITESPAARAVLSRLKDSSAEGILSRYGFNVQPAN